MSRYESESASPESDTARRTTPQIDVSRPHAARMYDYFLGGKDHFAADRETAEKRMQSWHAVRTGVRENRSFLGRAVRYLAEEAGIRQFLDIGTGLPSANNVHEVAQSVAPESRVVYVDNDPIVLAHAKALLTSTPEGRTAYIDADLREPEKILAHPAARDLLDFTEPIALLLVAVLHFIPDADDPHRDRTHAGRRPAAGQLPGRLARHGRARPGGRRRPGGLVQLGRRPGAGTPDGRVREPGLRRPPPGRTGRRGGLRLASRGRRPRPTAAEVSCYGGIAYKA